MRPNAVPQAQKMEWLDRVERCIKTEVVDIHEGAQECTFEGYGARTPDSTVLLAQEPYSQLYVWWLVCQMDLMNNEIDRYQNSAALYNSAYGEYVRWYNRAVMPCAAPRWNRGGRKL
jgi:hypothetical protein